MHTYGSPLSNSLLISFLFYSPSPLNSSLFFTHLTPSPHPLFSLLPSLAFLASAIPPALISSSSSSVSLPSPPLPSIHDSPLTLSFHLYPLRSASLPLLALICSTYTFSLSFVLYTPSLSHLFYIPLLSLICSTYPFSHSFVLHTPSLSHLFYIPLLTHLFYIPLLSLICSTYTFSLSFDLLKVIRLGNAQLASGTI